MWGSFFGSIYIFFCQEFSFNYRQRKGDFLKLTNKKNSILHLLKRDKTHVSGLNICFSLEIKWVPQGNHGSKTPKQQSRYFFHFVFFYTLIKVLQKAKYIHKWEWDFYGHSARLIPPYFFINKSRHTLYWPVMCHQISSLGSRIWHVSAFTIFLRYSSAI